MNLRTITRILIIPGALLLGLGFFMDVTVDSDYGPVVNFHKQSRQMTYLISGGSLLIAGVVLYGFRKLKQSPEEELEERKRAQEVERKAREKLVAVKGKIESAENPLHRIFVSSTDEQFKLRILAGTIAALVPVLMLLLAELTLASLVVLVLIVSYPLRAKPAPHVISRLAQVNLVVCSLVLAMLVWTISNIQQELSDPGPELWTGTIFGAAILLGICLALYYLRGISRRRAQSELDLDLQPQNEDTNA